MATIRKRSEKYEAQVRKDGRYVCKTFINKFDAIKWSKEQEVEIEQGRFISKKGQSILFGKVISRYKHQLTAIL